MSSTRQVKQTRKLPLDSGINLGDLQLARLEAEKALKSAERALARAQELRDSARSAFFQADQALRDGSRAVLG